MIAEFKLYFLFVRLAELYQKQIRNICIYQFLVAHVLYLGV